MCSCLPLGAVSGLRTLKYYDKSLAITAFILETATNCTLRSVKYIGPFFLVHLSIGALVQLLDPDPYPVTLTTLPGALSFFISFLCFPASCRLA